MVKKCIMLAALATAMTTALCADQPKHNPERAAQPATRREEPRRSRPRMSPPVYAPSETKSESTSKADRSKLDNARRRRIEIMVLINACKIMPEADRAPLKKELLKRIDADFQAMVVDQKERIARAEAELQRLRQELDEREKKREELVKREFERLLNMPAPGFTRQQTR